MKQNTKNQKSQTHKRNKLMQSFYKPI
uniref:Uncharacterized protein n=1 Tax=Rhizophora mucronata TaxID=61149 RepID=A0A2P2R505_RHIMU